MYYTSSAQFPSFALSLALYGALNFTRRRPFIDWLIVLFGRGTTKGVRVVQEIAQSSPLLLPGLKILHASTTHEFTRSHCKRHAENGPPRCRARFLSPVTRRRRRPLMTRSEKTEQRERERRRGKKGGSRAAEQTRGTQSPRRRGRETRKEARRGWLHYGRARLRRQMRFATQS